MDHKAQASLTNRNATFAWLTHAPPPRTLDPDVSTDPAITGELFGRTARRHIQRAH